MDLDLADRRLLVTGASSGIGEAVARAVLRRGGRVAGIARRVARLEAIPGLVAVPADVCDPVQVDAAVAGAVASLGGLDGIVCAAGINRPGLISDTTFDEWRAILDTNVLGLLNVVKAAMPALVEGTEPTLVTISSNAAHQVTSPQNAVYAASKSAVRTLADAVRLELAGRVRVAEVAPAYVRDTEIHREYRDPQHKAEADERQQRNGMAREHFAELVVDVLAQPADIEVRSLLVSKPGYVVRPYQR